MSVLAIDAGTTGVTARRRRATTGRISAKGYQEFAQHFPQPGLGRARARRRSGRPRSRRRARCSTKVDAARAPGGRHHQPARDHRCSGTARRSGRRDARSSGRTGVPPTSASRLRDEGHEDRVTELTGLRLDPYFSGTKLTWLAEHEPHTWALVESGRYAIGTVDSYLVARMTRGTWHVTDVSNACRTLLFDLEARRLVRRAVRAVRRPARRAARAGARAGARSRTTDPASFLRPRAARSPGIAGRPAVRAVRPDLLRRGRLASAPTAPARSSSPTPASASSAPTPGCSPPRPGARPTATLTYASEGAIFVTGAAVQWLRDGLQIVGSAAETEAIAATVDDTEGVVFVPGADRPRAPRTGTRTRAA